MTAIVAGIALALVAFGLNGRLTLGPLALSINDARKPLAWGSVAATWLLVGEWTQSRWRRFALAALTMMALLALISYGRHAEPVITDSDFAVGELYTELATRGQLSVGPYSRFGWHHPGPIFFYITAPFYALSGHRAPALYAVALAINLAAIVTLTWIVARERNRWPLAVLLAGGCILFAWRAPRLLASPWTGHVAVLPSLAFLVVSAAVASGRRALLPLLALVGSFVAQTHVGFVPTVVSISMGVLAVCVVERTGERRALWRTLNRTAWILSALWLLPISEAVSGAGGNAAALWRFFVIGAESGHSWREAFLNWSYGLSGILRPDFDLPWGGHFDLNHLWWGIPCAVGQLLLLAVIARHDFRTGRRFEGCLAVVAVAASLVSLWGLTGIQGDILNHDAFRIAALGTFNLAIICSAGVGVFFDAVAHTWHQRPHVRATALLLVLSLMMAVGAADLESLTSFERRRTERATIVKAYTAIRDFVAAEGIRRPLFRIDDDRWGDAAGIILRLQRDGTPVAVQRGSLSMFTGAFAPTGDEDAVIALANLGLHRELRQQPDTVVLFESSRLFIDVRRIVPRL